jgi:hypothetical protein
MHISELLAHQVSQDDSLTKQFVHIIIHNGRVEFIRWVTDPKGRDHCLNGSFKIPPYQRPVHALMLKEDPADAPKPLTKKCRIQFFNRQHYLVVKIQDVLDDDTLTTYYRSPFLISFLSLKLKILNGGINTVLGNWRFETIEVDEKAIEIKLLLDEKQNKATYSKPRNMAIDRFHEIMKTATGICFDGLITVKNGKVQELESSIWSLFSGIDME